MECATCQLQKWMNCQCSQWIHSPRRLSVPGFYISEEPSHWQHFTAALVAASSGLSDATCEATCDSPMRFSDPKSCESGITGIQGFLCWSFIRFSHGFSKDFPTSSANIPPTSSPIIATRRPARGLQRSQERAGLRQCWAQHRAGPGKSPWIRPRMILMEVIIPVKNPQFNEILINPKDIPIEDFFSWIDFYIIILILIDFILIYQWIEDSIY